MFQFWSDTKKEAKDELRPDFGFRSWDKLDIDEKRKVWLYLWKRWFFAPEQFDADAFYSEEDHKTLREREQIKKLKRIIQTLQFLNQTYKAKALARSFLEMGDIGSALKDFYNLFIHGGENIVFEQISVYAKVLSIEIKEDLRKKEDETNEEYDDRNEAHKWLEFDKFADDLNDVLEQFGVYVVLTRRGLIPRQDEKIIDEIYEPVLRMLSGKKFEKVNEILSDAFGSFGDGDYDTVIQCSINAVHSFLQTILGSKQGKENLSILLKQAKAKGIIPNDSPMSDLYNNIEGFLARLRKDKTKAHPSEGIPTRQEALFVLNLTMVVMQSFLIH